MLHDVLMWCLNHPGEIVGAVLGILTIFKGQQWVDGSLRDARAQRIMGFAHIAFHAVEEAARLAPGKMDGAAKLAAFLDTIDTALEGGGHAPMSAPERTAAADVAKAINAKLQAPAANP